MEESVQPPLSTRLDSAPIAAAVSSTSFFERLSFDIGKITMAAAGIWAGVGAAAKVSPLLGTIVGVVGMAGLGLNSSVKHLDHANERMRMEWNREKSPSDSEVEKRTLTDSVCKRSNKRFTLATVLTAVVMGLTYPASDLGQKLFQNFHEQNPPMASGESPRP